MNNVSWFLYLVDVLTTTRMIVGPLFGVFGTIAMIALVVAYNVYEHDYDYVGNERVYKNRYPARDFATSILRWFTPLWIICILIVLLTPSKNTIYLIAASQVGEQIIQLESVQELGGEAGSLAKDTISLLRQQIQEQLNKPVEAPKAD